MTRLHTYRDHGFTLIELLVVIAIIGVLLGLTLPAVQQVRGSALRLKCANNLHQIGLAAHHYHDVNHCFPAGMRYQGGRDPYRLMTWHAQLLPYLEQQPLWAATQNAYRQNPDALRNPPHIGLSTVVPLFTCPADARPDSVQTAQREQLPVALTSYLGVEGRDVTTLDGVLFRDSRIRITDITDGTSQTLLVGERPPSADFQFGWWYAGAGQLFTGSADMVLGVEEPNLLLVTTGSCAPGVYRFGPGRIDNQCDMFHFWSLHRGGAHFLYADGSTHFLAYSAAGILPALASRAGGEVVSDPD
jgi:prepilin-type N-terminal cleavage/methylation domain-containing protein/prepilin-type processing-associated H-X9-DG protein